MQYDENLYRSMNVSYHSNSVFHEIVILAGNSGGGGGGGGILLRFFSLV